MAAPAQTLTVPVSAGVSTFLLGSNPKRTALTFFSPTANRVTIAFGAPAALDQGPTVQPGTTPVRLVKADLGEVIERPVNGIAAVAITNLTFVEEMEW